MVYVHDRFVERDQYFGDYQYLFIFNFKIQIFLC